MLYIHEPWIFIRIFLSEWIFRHGYYHGDCMDSLTRVDKSFLKTNLNPTFTFISKAGT